MGSLKDFMKMDSYKNLKKAEWQELATKFSITWNEESVVRYLVEKIAEKIGVDDKIVSDIELKKQVLEMINNNPNILNPPKKEKTTSAKVKVTTAKVKVTTAKVKKEIKKVEENIVPALSRLEELRKECELYGVAWVEKHTEEGLEQLINAIKSAGVVPITNSTFEISADNVNSIEKATENVITQTNLTPTNVIPTNEATIINSTVSSKTILESYRQIYVHAVKSHFRCLSYNEIEQMITRDVVPFIYKINRNKEQANKLEIILTIGKDTIRVPSDDVNDWLTING
jgi:hypothetical protein